MGEFLCYNTLMIDWSFSFGWFALGALILGIGAAIVIFYQQISDNFISGVSSYDKVKLAGIIIAIVGLLIMANLHTLILSAFVNLVFKR